MTDISNPDSLALRVPNRVVYRYARFPVIDSRIPPVDEAFFEKASPTAHQLDRLTHSYFVSPGLSSAGVATPAARRDEAAIFMRRRLSGGAVARPLSSYRAAIFTRDCRRRCGVFFSSRPFFFSKKCFLFSVPFAPRIDGIWFAFMFDTAERGHWLEGMPCLAEGKGYA